MIGRSTRTASSASPSRRIAHMDRGQCDCRGRVSPDRPQSNTCFRATAGNCSRSAEACSAFVTVQMRCGKQGASVAPRLLQHRAFTDNIQKLFRRAVRLRGQKRVPRPPAKNHRVSCQRVLSFHSAPITTRENCLVFKSLVAQLPAQRAGSGTVTRRTELTPPASAGWSADSPAKPRLAGAIRMVLARHHKTCLCLRESRTTELFGSAFNGCGPVQSIAPVAKIRTRPEDTSLRRANATPAARFAAAPTAEIRHFQRFFNVQFAWLAGGAHAAKIVNAIGEIRIFLDFTNYQDRRPWHAAFRRDEIRIAVCTGMCGSRFPRSCQRGPEKLLLVPRRLQPEKNFRAGLRPDQMPHLGFSAAAGGLLVLCGVGIAGMHRDGQLVVGKNKFE